MLPRHLAWPGLRECDVTDDRTRRGMYGIVLSQGKRNDIARFVNAGLLSQDWPWIRESLDPRLRRQCERRFALGAGPASRAVSGGGASGGGASGGAGPTGPEPAAESAPGASR